VSLAKLIVHSSSTEVIVRDYAYSILILAALGALLLGMVWQHDCWVENQKAQLHSWQEQRMEEAFVRELRNEKELIEYRNAVKF